MNLQQFNLNKLKENPKSIKSYDFVIYDGDKEKENKLFLDPFKLSAYLEVANPEEVAKWFKEKKAEKEYQIYENKLKSYLFMIGLKNKDKILEERLLNELPFNVAEGTFESIGMEFLTHPTEKITDEETLDEEKD